MSNRLPTHSFTLRDYIAFLIPGSVVIFGIFIIHPNLYQYITGNIWVSSAIFLIVSYIIGDICLTISLTIIIPLINMIFGNPSQILSNNKKWFWNRIKIIDEDFKSELINTLKKHWGDWILNARPGDVLLLCRRFIQVNSLGSDDYINRLLSLYSMSAALITAILSLLIIVLLEKMWIYASITITVLVITLMSHYLNKAFYIRTIYHSYYAYMKKPSLKEEGV